MKPSRRHVLGMLASLATAVRLRGAAPASAPASRPTTPPLGGPEAAALRQTCDALIARAVRSAYGWGWAEGEAGYDPAHNRVKRGTPHPIDGMLTARTGILLDWAGRALADAPYRAAALEAARGLAAIQTRAGQVQKTAVMGLVAAGREDVAGEVPDRAATCAALGLLVQLLAGQNPLDARQKSSVQRSAHWLGKQQSQTGGWASLYAVPDATPQRSVQLLRLDTADFRDAALAILLAADVIDDAQLASYFDRSVEKLLSMRVQAGRPARRFLWAAAYRLDGDSTTHLSEFPSCIDLMGSRRAIEILFAGYVLAGKSKLEPPLKEARGCIAALERDGQGHWFRRYNLVLSPLPAPATQPSGVFSAPVPELENPDPRTLEILARLDRLDAVGFKAFRDEMEKAASFRRRVAWSIAGLAPGALLIDDEMTPHDRDPILAGSGTIAELLDIILTQVRGRIALGD